MQPILAEGSSDVAKWLGDGGPAYANGAKASSCDEVLSVAQALHRQEGEAPSRWADCEEFEKFAQEYGRCDACFGMGDPAGLTLETPFGDDSVLTRLTTEAIHPQLRNGLQITLRVPMAYSLDQATEETAFLNFLEALGWTNFPQFGCWHPFAVGEDRALLAHTTFVPNALYQPRAVNVFAQWSVARANWVRQQRFPDLKDLTMAEILERRFGPFESPKAPH